MPTPKKNIYSHIKQCKNCGSSLGAVSNGFRYVVNKQTGEKERVQRYKCKNCHKAFYPASTINKSDRLNEKKQVHRLILHLYISGKTRGEITKALQEYPVGLESVNDYINDFFNELSPSVRKFLNDQRPGTKIKSYHQCVNKITDEPKYSLYLQEGEDHLAYALFFSNMPSIVNILLDNLLDPQPVFRNDIKNSILKKIGEPGPINVYQIAEIVTNEVKRLAKSPYCTTRNTSLFQLERRLKEAYNYEYDVSYQKKKANRSWESDHIKQEEYYNPDGKPIYMKK